MIAIAKDAPNFLRQLMYFVRAAELGSISAAAAALEVTQPAVSKQIDRLEENLGTILLQRDYSGVHLTPAGSALLDRAKVILTQLDATKNHLSAFRNTQERSIRLGVTSPASHVLVTPTVQGALKKFPRIKLVIKDGTSEELRRWLEAGELDVAVSNRTGEWSSLITEPIAVQEFYLIGPREKVKDEPKPIRFKDLSDYPLMQGGFATSLLRQEAIEKIAAVRNVRLSFDFGSPINIRKDIMRTLGRCTVTFYSLFEKEISTGELAARPIRQPRLTQTLYLARTKASTSPDDQTEICDLVKAITNNVIRLGRYKWRNPNWKPKDDFVEL